jgi:hypothetical protein
MLAEGIYACAFSINHPPLSEDFSFLTLSLRKGKVRRL